MVDLKLEGELFEKVEKLTSKFPSIAEEVIKKSIRKSVNYMKLEEKKYMEKTYAITDKSLLTAKNLKVKANSYEGKLIASSKKNDISQFKISMTKPGKSPNFMKAGVLKSTGLSTMRTMFWGFYKSGSKEPALYIRNGEERYKISRVKTLGVSQMGLKIITDKQEERLQEIFYKELSKKIDEVL